MKFSSKASSYTLILRAHVGGSPPGSLPYYPPTPGIKVEFKDGSAIVPDSKKDVIEMLLEHPQYGKTFQSLDLDPEDRFYVGRGKAPEQVLTEIVHGAVGEIKSARPLATDARTQITELAKEIAKSMAPAMAKEIAQNAIAELLPGITAKIRSDLKAEMSEAKTGEKQPAEKPAEAPDAKAAEPSAPAEVPATDGETKAKGKKA
jgi:hypothetical protein